MKNTLNRIKKNPFIFSFWVLIVSIMFAVLITPVDINDYYWHVKVGEYIADTGAVPKNGVFSWYALENYLPWIAHEWLFERFIYSVQKGFGEFGVFLFTVTSSLSLIFILIWNTRKSLFNIHKGLSLLWMTFAIVSVSLIQSARPHMFMFLFMALLTTFLYYYKDHPDTRLIYLMPVLSLVWVNVHGGSSNMIYILPVLFLISHLFEFRFGALMGTRLETGSLIKLGITTLASGLLLILNPNGLDMVLYPYLNMGDSLMLEVIQEWQSADIKNSMDFTLIFIPIFIQVAVFTVRNKKIKIYDLLIFSFYAYLTLRSVRFAYLLYLVQSLILFEGFPKKKNSYSFNNLSPLLVGLAVGLSLIKLATFNGVEHQAPLTEDMIDVIKQESPQRILNDYNFGGYLIYHDVEVYIDGRADMYSRYNLKYVMDFKNFKMDYIDSYLKSERFDYILMQKERPINNYLMTDKDWKLVKKDDYAHFYKYVGEEWGKE